MLLFLFNESFDLHFSPRTGRENIKKTVYIFLDWTIIIFITIIIIIIGIIIIIIIQAVRNWFPQSVHEFGSPYSRCYLSQ